MITYGKLNNLPQPISKKEIDFNRYKKEDIFWLESLILSLGFIALSFFNPSLLFNAALGITEAGIQTALAKSEGKDANLTNFAILSAVSLLPLAPALRRTLISKYGMRELEFTQEQLNEIVMSDQIVDWIWGIGGRPQNGEGSIVHAFNHFSYKGININVNIEKNSFIAREIDFEKMFKANTMFKQRVESVKKTLVQKWESSLSRGKVNQAAGFQRQLNILKNIEETEARLYEEFKAFLNVSAGARAGETISDEAMAQAQYRKDLGKYLTPKLYKAKNDILRFLESNPTRIKNVTDFIQTAGKAGWSLTGKEAWAILRVAKDEFSMYISTRLNLNLIFKGLGQKTPSSWLATLNRILDYTNPDALVGRLFDKITDPIRNAVKGLIRETSEKIWTILKRFSVKVTQRLERDQLILTPTSSWILGLYSIADPLIPGRYRVWVEFKKPGYERVMLTPALTLTDIERFIALSAGKQYHKYRRLYAVSKSLPGGEYIGRINELTDALGFFPDQMITASMGIISKTRAMSRNIANFSNLAQLVRQEAFEKIGEVFAGEWGKEISKRIFTGQGFTDYGKWIMMKFNSQAKKHESAVKKLQQKNKGQIEAIRSIKNLF